MCTMKTPATNVDLPAFTLVGTHYMTYTLYERCIVDSAGICEVRKTTGHSDQRVIGPSTYAVITRFVKQSNTPNTRLLR